MYDVSKKDEVKANVVKMNIDVQLNNIVMKFPYCRSRKTSDACVEHCGCKKYPSPVCVRI